MTAVTIRPAESDADLDAWRRVRMEVVPQERTATLEEMRVTLHWAAQNGLTEVYTWTQRGNADMRRLNEHLGFVTRTESIRYEKVLG